MANCPYCDKPFSHVIAQDVSAGGTLSDQWNAIAYSCPSCHRALSVAIDPVAIKADIVREVLEALGKA